MLAALLAVLPGVAAAQADSESGVTATVTIDVPAEACIVVDLATTLDFGELDFGETAPSPTPGYGVQSCSTAGQSIYGHSTAATNATPTTWTLNDSGIPLTDEFSVDAALDGGSPVWLGSTPGTIGQILAGATLPASHTFAAPPAGSAGAGETLGFDLTWTAVVDPFWSTQTVLGGDGFMESVDFADADNGWAVGFNGENGGAIHATTDGGATWTPQTSGTTSWLMDVMFSDANMGWAVGERGAILATTNGGTTWTTQTSGATTQLNGVSFVDANTGWVVGDGGTIVATTNAGTTWTTQTSGTTNYLRGVSFVDANTGWAVGQNGIILATTNGGATWNSQPSGTAGVLHGVSFVDANTGWVVGQNGTILATTDGGATWTGQPSGTTISTLLAVSFVDANTGWTAYQNSILSTTDGGATWTAEPVGTGVRALAFVDDDRGWAISGGGTILAYR